MNLVLNLPADLEAILEKRAEHSGLDIPTYVLRTLRISDFDQAGDASISNEQSEARHKRLREIHASCLIYNHS